MLCLTFDDRNFDQWTNAAPVLARYNAHASFFPYGNLSRGDLDKLRILHSAGHTIGSHTVDHCRVPALLNRRILPFWRFWISEVWPHKKTLNAIGIQLQSFAYPYGEYTEESNVSLARHVNRLRGAGFRNYITNGVSLVSLDSAYVKKESLSTRPYVPSVLVGESYDTDIADLCKAVERIASTDEVLVLTSHGISPDAKDINMKMEWLIALCEACQRGGVDMLGLDELPTPQGTQSIVVPIIFCAGVVLLAVSAFVRKRTDHG